MKYIHRLVAEHFIDKPDMTLEVNHKDKCRGNNCIENLELVTSLVNQHHKNDNPF
jgi:hypothetical protein